MSAAMGRPWGLQTLVPQTYFRACAWIFQA